MIQKGLLKLRSANLTLTLGLGIALIAVAAVLAQSVISSIKIEAEQGTISGQATVASDSGASNGSYLNFTTGTTPPPAGTQFQSTFETLSSFMDQFDMHTGNFCSAAYPPNCRPEDISDSIKSFPGDHDMACQGPTTTRTVSISNHSNLFWWCAPGNDPTKGHIMIGLDTSGYSIVSIAPKPVFTEVSEVCWDINRTDLGGGKWFNVLIVPESLYLQHPNLNPTRAQELEGPYRLDYTSPGFNADNAPGDFNLQGGPTFGLKMFRTELHLWTNNASDEFVWSGGDGWVAGDDKATRYKHCMKDNGNNTITITQASANGTDTTVVNNASMPNGRVKIIFQNDDYDTVKHGGREGFKTWHLDNIIIK